MKTLARSGFPLLSPYVLSASSVRFSLAVSALLAACGGRIEGVPASEPVPNSPPVAASGRDAPESASSGSASRDAGGHQDATPTQPPSQTSEPDEKRDAAMASGCQGEATQACDLCGTRSRACLEGRWSAWSACRENLESDPNNCGACGRSCGSAACTKGTCGAEVICSIPSARGSKDFRSIAMAANTLYYTGSSGEVLACDAAVRRGWTISSEEKSPAQITVDPDGDSVAWADTEAGKVRGLHLLGDGIAVTRDSELIRPYGLGFAGNNTYFTHEDTLMRAWGAPSIRGLHTPREVVMGTEMVYVVDAGPALARMGRIVGCTKYWRCDLSPTVLSDKLNAPHALTIAGDWMYFTDKGDGSGPGAIYRCDLPTCSQKPKKLADTQPGAAHVQADANFVYWSAEGSSSIWRCPATGCVASPIVVHDAVGSIGAFLLAGDYLFVPIGKELYRVSK